MVNAALRMLAYWVASPQDRAVKSTHLSILLPTYRHSLAAVSRVAQVCSWGGSEVEVIVRDNSGNAKKRELISQFKGEHCSIVFADPCEPGENTSETLKLAKGEFIFLVGDDDQGFDGAIHALPTVLKQCGKDPAVVGVTGFYAIEMTNSSAIHQYTGVDSDDAAARVAGYLSYSGPNLIFYSVLRREVVQRTVSFMNRMPVSLSFHDQILSLLYLLSGKLVRLPRLLYAYDYGVWQSPETAQSRDLDFYTAAGLDPAINKLHWFLCGFEGAVLIRNSALFPDYPLAQRQEIADRWFSAMFGRFKGQDRFTRDSKFAGEAEKICAKLLASTGQMSFQGMLAEICGLIALSAREKARRYHDFWDAQINRRAAAVRLVEMGAASGAL
jgi:hypothetical protein